MGDDLWLKVHGEPGTIPVEVFAKALAGFTKMLPAGGWFITDLSVSSARAAAAPARVDAQTRTEIEAVLSGVTMLSAGEADSIPDGWTEEMLTGLAEIAEVVVAGWATEVSSGAAEPLVVTSVALTNSAVLAGHEPQIDIGQETLSFGSVVGVVDRVMIRDNRRNFGLRDEGTGHTVSVMFSADDLETVRQALGHRAEAWGLLHRSSSGRKRRLEMEGMTLIPSPPAKSPTDLVGILPKDWTEGLTSVAWVRRQRDEG